MFFGPHPHHLQHVLALLCGSIRQFFEYPLVLTSLGEALLHQGELLPALLFSQKLEVVLLAEHVVTIEQEGQTILLGEGVAHGIIF